MTRAFGFYAKFLASGPPNSHGVRHGHCLRAADQPMWRNLIEFKDTASRLLYQLACGCDKIEVKNCRRDRECKLE